VDGRCALSLLAFERFDGEPAQCGVRLTGDPVIEAVVKRWRHANA